MEAITSIWNHYDFILQTHTHTAHVTLQKSHSAPRSTGVAENLIPNFRTAAIAPSAVVYLKCSNEGFLRISIFYISSLIPFLRNRSSRYITAIKTKMHLLPISKCINKPKCVDLLECLDVSLSFGCRLLSDLKWVTLVRDWRRYYSYI